MHDANWEDSDDNLVQDFKNWFDISNQSTGEPLKDRYFLIDAKLTKAAISLLASIRQFFPQACVRFQLFDGKDMGTGSSFNVIKVQAFILTQLREFQYLDDNC